MDGTMPRDWHKDYKESTYGDIPTINLGESIRLEPNESVVVNFRNLYGRRYRMVLNLHVDPYSILQWKVWVNAGEDKTKKVTNTYLHSCALFTHVDTGSWIDRLRDWLKV